MWSTLIVGIIVGGAIGFAISILYFKFSYKKEIEEAYGTREKILEEARREAQTIKKEAEIQAKDYYLKEKRRFERESQEERRSLDKERRKLEEKSLLIEKRADQLNRKERDLRKKEQELMERERSLDAKEQRLDKLIEEQAKKLEEVARLTREEAKAELLKNLEQQARYEASQLVYRIREEAKQKAEKEAQKIIADAIQRCALPLAQDLTVTVVSIPSDDLKGRIIGREGRNIKTFENITGVEVIIDDTPEAVTLSSHNPELREKARLALERLVKDGRIHPARIEEVYKKVEEEFEQYLKMIGEETALELGLSGFHPEILKYIGKMKFRYSYGQNLLQHSKEVAYIAGVMAGELNLPVEFAKRAGLLHDIGKVAEPDYEGPHAVIGAQIAKKFGENDLVVNSIAAHHGDEDPRSVNAILVATADAISGARPGARRESIEAYIKRIETLEEIAHSFPGVEKAYALQAGREIRVMVEADKVNDIEAFDLARKIAEQIEEKLEYPGQIKVTVIRETRAVEFAK